MSERSETRLGLLWQLRRAGRVLSKVEITDVVSRNLELMAVGGRPGLSSPAFNHLKSYGPVGDGLIDPPSSDENSDLETGTASLRTAVDSLLDTKLCEISETYLPVQYHKPALIFLNLKNGITSAKLKTALFPLSDGIWKTQIVDFPLETGFCRCGIVFLDSENEGFRLFSVLKIEEESGALDSRLSSESSYGRTVSVRWLRNQALDPAGTWAAVVLRDVDKTCTVTQIRALLQEKHVSVLRIEPPRAVNSSFCALIITPDIDTAEKVCKAYHRKVVLGGVWKVNVHPYSHIGKIDISTQDLSVPPQSQGRKFDYSDIYQMIQGDAEKKAEVKDVINQNPLKKLIRKRAKPREEEEDQSRGRRFE